MHYRYFIEENPEKFLKKNKKDTVTTKRIYEEIKNITQRPFHPKYKFIKSKRCPQCQRARVGNLRIIFYVDKEKNEIYILDIIKRSINYRRYSIL